MGSAMGYSKEGAEGPNSKGGYTYAEPWRRTNEMRGRGGGRGQKVEKLVAEEERPGKSGKKSQKRTIPNATACGRR